MFRPAPPEMVVAEIMQTQGSVDANSAMRNGYIGRALGFDFHISNNVETIEVEITEGGTVSTISGHAIMAGTKRAISFAEQILNIEAYRPESSFSDAVKGLHVYGAKVVDPKALVTVYGRRIDEV